MTALLLRRETPDVEAAFERLYRTYVQDVYKYALMVMRSPADAEDVTQTTFLKAYRAFQRGDRPEKPQHWLIKIAHNTCRTRFRDASRRPQEVALEEGRAAAPAAPESDADAPSVDEIREALAHLSLNQRSALVMRELEGRSYAEIGEVLGLSGSAVETLLFRARRALREQLQGELSCGQAERALSKDLDGRLGRDEKGQLRAHLRACKECATLARRQRAQRAVLRGLGPIPLPPSLASFFGGGAAGTGIAVKVAALVAAGVVTAGAGYETVKAIDTQPQAPRPQRVLVPDAVARPSAAHREIAPLERAGARVVVAAKSGAPAVATPSATTAGAGEGAAWPGGGSVGGGAAPAAGSAPRTETPRTGGGAAVTTAAQAVAKVLPVPKLPVSNPEPPVKVEVPAVAVPPVAVPPVTVPEVTTPVATTPAVTTPAVTTPSPPTLP